MSNEQELSQYIEALESENATLKDKVRSTLEAKHTAIENSKASIAGTVAMQDERDALRARAEKAEELLRGAMAGEEVSWDDLARIARYWIGERKP